jgi:hypothetical protein
MTKKEKERLAIFALLLGYNELAKGTEVLGEKILYRMLCMAAEKRYKKLGGKINRTETPVVLVLGPKNRPHVIFMEQDIEMMREAVRVFDEKKAAEKDG